MYLKQADIPAGNHKYIAHQIALLYQALSYQNLKCGAFKKRIEPKFETIKKITEASTTPVNSHTCMLNILLPLAALDISSLRLHTLVA